MITNIRQYIEKMPKVELHLHLDGAFTLDFLFNLIQKYGGDPIIGSISDLQDRFVFKDFPHFIETWFWKNQFFREPIDFEESVYQTLQKLSHQNIVYLEAFFSPWDYKKSGVNPTDIVQANLNAVKRAEQDLNIGCKLIADICRDNGQEDAMNRLNEITPYLGDHIIGIGLGGSEQRYPANLFKDVFVEAKKRGFHCVAHAGEVMGTESIWSAIRDLKVERVGHGVHAIEDPELIGYLRDKQIPLEVCITSNIKTGVYQNFTDHPFNELFSKGLLLTVNSDDPTMFDTTLADELLTLYNKFNLKLSDIKQIQINAVDASFASVNDKNNYKEMMNRFWNDIQVQLLQVRGE